MTIGVGFAQVVVNLTKAIHAQAEAKIRATIMTRYLL